MNFPANMLPFFGIGKTLGVIAILVPGFDRLKEWAFAGLMIDLSGATYLILMAGLPLSVWASMALPIALGIGSYVYYHKRLRLTRRSPTYQVS